MQAIGRRPVVLFLLTIPLFSAEPVDVIAQLASALSKNDSVGALEAFDPKMKDYASIESRLSALTSQADILCALDVVSEKDSDGARTLDVDWYMQLKSQAGSGPTERRRERVTLQLRQARGKWKIVSFFPLNILEPINIR